MTLGYPLFILVFFINQTVLILPSTDSLTSRSGMQGIHLTLQPQVALATF